MEKIYDVIVIGGGVVGTAILDRLARYDLAALLLEKENDVSCGASRANSGIVHAGYDCKPNTLKARFNVRGNRLMWQLAKQLDVPANKCGTLVVAPSEGYDGIAELYQKGKKNGVDVKILNKEEALLIEPNLSDEIEYALYAPEGGIVSPYKLTIALADRAILNGAEILLEAEVTAISRKEDYYSVETARSAYCARTIINCAGASGARVNELAHAEHYDTEYRKGEYFVLDSVEGSKINTVVFPLPTAKGKGILVAPTADGNVLYGPTSSPADEGDTSVSQVGLDEIRHNVALTYKNPDYRKCIRVYAGVRTIIGDDFIVAKSALIPSYIMAIGICSPGLTSAPAIAEYVEKLYIEDFHVKKKENPIETIRHKRLLCDEELNELISQNPQWGKIVCRCEKVTEAEIVAAIHSPLPAVTVDSVKRRVRAGMGRCQGGFCAPRVMQILARELNLPVSSIKKGIGDSSIVVCSVKEADDE